MATHENPRAVSRDDKFVQHGPRRAWRAEGVSAGKRAIMFEPSEGSASHRTEDESKFLLRRLRRSQRAWVVPSFASCEFVSETRNGLWTQRVGKENIQSPSFIDVFRYGSAASA
jgi:hypothetical protein